MTTPETPRAAARPCPICGRPEDPERKPFCSKRCADVDLHRWLSGGYAIPGPTLEDEEDRDASGEGETLPPR